MSEKLKELPSEGTLKNLQVKQGEISKNIKDLQSKITEIYARDLQHTQLSGKVDNLQAWAIDMKGTLDKVDPSHRDNVSIDTTIFEPSCSCSW